MPWTVNPDHGYLERFTTAGSIGALTNIDVDAHTPPGTDPVMPNGSDNIIFTGAQVASGVIGANVLRTNSLAASSVTYEIQQSGSASSQNTALNGVAHFNSSHFTVANGFVSLTGGGQAVDSFTTDLSGPVSPDSSGNVAFTGSTNIFSDGSVANTMRLNLQGTNHALFIGRGSNTASTSLSLGSSGQILQSAGAGSDPAWTTSTYPSTNSQGDIIYGSASNVLSTLAKDTNSTRYLSNTGTSNNPAWAQVDLTNGVTGVLPIANGGTNANTFATTDGTVYFDGTRLVTTATGSSGQVLTSNGPGVAPTYQSNANGDVTGPGSSTDNALVRFDGTTGKLIQNGVITEDDTGNLSISAAVSGASLSATVANTSNTASATAFYNAQVAGGTASDAYYKAEISGGQAWTWGLDNSVSDGFAIAASSTLGTSNVISATTSGAVSIPLGDFDVTRSNNGGNVLETVSNTSNTASSGASKNIVVAGTSGGDPWSQYTIGTTRSYAIGPDNSDSDSLKINTDSDGTVDPSSGTNLWTMTTAGQLIMPLQPCFAAYRTANATNTTGDATAYTVVFDSEYFDIGSNFNAGTGTFTAPVTGKYLFTCGISVTNLAVGHTSAVYDLTASSGAILKGGLINPTACRDLTFNICTLPNVSGIMSLTAGDTVTMVLTVRGSTKTVAVFGAAGTFFTGALIC